MHSKDVLIEAYGRPRAILQKALEGLTAEQLAYRPSAKANSIAWLAWHLSRVQDSNISRLSGKEQEWISGGWHAKFGLPADAAETGHGHSDEQVAQIRPSSAQLLLDYHEAVYQNSVKYIDGLSRQDLEVTVDGTRYDPPPTVGVRLVSVLTDNTQHAGQINYVRGLIEDRHWLGS
jgi:uncharacterized damage-inducible protein DinB